MTTSLFPTIITGRQVIADGLTVTRVISVRGGAGLIADQLHQLAEVGLMTGTGLLQENLVSESIQIRVQGDAAGMMPENITCISKHAVLQVLML
jgi:hypothetical protein